MPILRIGSQSIAIPDSYREWTASLHQDFARRAYELISQATDTTGQRHQCATTILQDVFEFGYAEASEYVTRAVETHMRQIDDYCRDLHRRGISLRARQPEFYQEYGITPDMQIPVVRGVVSNADIANWFASQYEDHMPESPKVSAKEPERPKTPKTAASLNVVQKPRKLRLKN